MMRGNRAQVGDIQRGRPDNDAESKDCDQGAKSINRSIENQSPKMA